MSEDGIEKINRGITTIDELFRVIYLRDGEAIFVCQNCGESVSQDLPTCPSCGYILVNQCPDCGGTRDPNWKFCAHCGKGFQAPPRPL